MFCVYITISRVNNLPPFYIGHSTIQKVNHGYRGSVSSIQYKKLWQQSIKKFPHLFITKIISIHEFRQDAARRERELLLKLDVLKNELYLNKCIHGEKYSPYKRNEHSRQKTSISVKKAYADGRLVSKGIYPLINKSPEERKEILSKIGKINGERIRKQKWTKEQIKKRIDTRNTKGNWNRDMSTANTPEAIAKRVQTRKQNTMLKSDLLANHQDYSKT